MTKRRNGVSAPARDMIILPTEQPMRRVAIWECRSDPAAARRASRGRLNVPFPLCV